MDWHSAKKVAKCVLICVVLQNDYSETSQVGILIKRAGDDAILIPNPKKPTKHMKRIVSDSVAQLSEMPDEVSRKQWMKQRLKMNLLGGMTQVIFAVVEFANVNNDHIKQNDRLSKACAAITGVFGTLGIVSCIAGLYWKDSDSDSFFSDFARNVLPLSGGLGAAAITFARPRFALPSLASGGTLMACMGMYSLRTVYKSFKAFQQDASPKIPLDQV
jgi:hypothetical protein